MKKLFALMLILFSTFYALGQGTCIHDKAIADLPVGFLRTLPGARITVCPAGAGTCTSGTSSVYTAPDLLGGHLITQPVVADSHGNYNFCAAPGAYFLQIAAQGFTTLTVDNVSFGVGTAVGNGIQVVSFSSTPAFNASNVTGFEITLTGNVTAPTLSNQTTGQYLTFNIIQDATGGRTFAWPTQVKNGALIAAAASSRTVQTFQVGSDANLYAVGPATYGVGSLPAIITSSAGGGSAAGLQVVASTAAAVGLRDTSQGADAKQWDVANTGSSFLVRAVNDANNSTTTAFSASRSGATVTGTAAAAPLTVAAIQGPGFQKQVFTGNGTFTIPAGITQVKVTVTGAGGSGGGSANAVIGSGGGGGGGTAIKYLTGLTPGGTLAVTVGAGVAGGTAGNNGGVGNNSTVASGTQSISTITGNGGLGGFANSAGGAGNGGGSSSGGDINMVGNPGTPGQTGTNVDGGPGGSSFFGGGGATAGAGSPGNAATNYGGGGGGAGSNAANSGGSSSAGIVIFEWIS